MQNTKTHKKSLKGTLEHTGTDCGDTQIQNTKCKEIQNSKYVKIQIVDSRDTADTAGSSGEADANCLQDFHNRIGKEGAQYGFILV